MITRRAFIGSMLLACPAARALARLAPLREATFFVYMGDGCPGFKITMYTCGWITATYGGHRMQREGSGPWHVFWCQEGGGLRCRRAEGEAVPTLEVDWLVSYNWGTKSYGSVLPDSRGECRKLVSPAPYYRGIPIPYVDRLDR